MATQPLPQPTRRRGFTPLPNFNLMDWARLASGDAQVLTLMFLASETLGAAREAGTNPPYWSRPIPTAEIAMVTRSHVRAIQLGTDDMAERGVIERKRDGMAWRYHIPFDRWASLPDRPAKVVSIDGDEIEDQPEDDEAANSLAGKVLPVFDAPRRYKAGGKPRPVELPAPAAKLRLHPSHDIEASAHICDGVLSIDLRVVDPEKRNGFRFSASKSQKTNKVELGNAPALDGWKAFELAARQVGMSRAAFDLAKATLEWAKLSKADKDAAVQGLLDRQAAGEFDGGFIHLPQNYLARELWTRPIRAKDKGSGKMDATRRFLDHMRNRSKS